jgi:hypothetical protein
VTYQRVCPGGPRGARLRRPPGKKLVYGTGCRPCRRGAAPAFPRRLLGINARVHPSRPWRMRQTSVAATLPSLPPRWLLPCLPSHGGFQLHPRTAPPTPVAVRPNTPGGSRFRLAPGHEPGLHLRAGRAHSGACQHPGGPRRGAARDRRLRRTAQHPPGHPRGHACGAHDLRSAHRHCSPAAILRSSSGVCSSASGVPGSRYLPLARPPTEVVNARQALPPPLRRSVAPPWSSATACAMACRMPSGRRGNTASAVVSWTTVGFFNPSIK